MPAQTLFDHLPDIALAAALAWGSGLRLYAVLFLLGLAGANRWLELPPHLAVLAHPLVLGASGFMALVESSADKIPWLDSIWDAVHTFVRIPAGAALAAAVFGAGDHTASLAAAILGGTVSAGTHLAKSGARAAINTSPEPLTNWAASGTEDLLVPAGLWLSVANPAVFLAALALFAVAVVLLLRFVAGGVAALWRALGFGKRRFHAD